MVRVPINVWVLLPFLTRFYFNLHRYSTHSFVPASGRGKSMDIVASGMFSMYEVNKMSNSILMIPWFFWLPTPASSFLQNSHDTMGKIPKQKMPTKNHYTFLVAIFSPVPPLVYWLNPISRKLPASTTSGVNFT